MLDKRDRQKRRWEGNRQKRDRVRPEGKYSNKQTKEKERLKWTREKGVVLHRRERDRQERKNLAKRKSKGEGRKQQTYIYYI